MNRRKFDIRQWILITSWNPLTIFFYEECYIRFSAVNYDSSNIKDNFIHLTNNSIAKYANCDFESEDQKFFGQNMWSSGRFAEWLKEREGYDAYNDKILPQIKKIVLGALKTASTLVVQRSNSLEMYGLDLMVDDALNVWLIECNSSPAMDYSTPITERMVKEISEDMMKVAIDNNHGRQKELGDIGKFSLLYRDDQAVK